MPSLRSLLSHFTVLALITNLANSKAISGIANITMTDLNTGALLGCLNIQGQVQNIETTGTTGPCNQFIAVPAPSGKGQGGKGAFIYAAAGVPCSFELIDRPGSEDQFMCDSSLDISTLNVWSLQGDELATNPQGSKFAEFTDGFFEAAITDGDTGTTPISLGWQQ